MLFYFILTFKVMTVEHFKTFFLKKASEQQKPTSDHIVPLALVFWKYVTFQFFCDTSTECQSFLSRSAIVKEGIVKYTKWVERISWKSPSSNRIHSNRTKHFVKDKQYQIGLISFISVTCLVFKWMSFKFSKDFVLFCYAAAINNSKKWDLN